MTEIAHPRTWLMGKSITLKNTILRMKPPAAVLIGRLRCKIIHPKRNASVRLAVPVREIWLISCAMSSIYLTDIHFISPLLIVF